LAPKKLKIKVIEPEKDADGFYKPEAPLFKSKTTAEARPLPNAGNNLNHLSIPNDKKESTP
jgi:hypothetical protein